MAVNVFVDFDGTITRNDVGNEFFRTFGGEQCAVYVGEYKREEGSAKDLFRAEVAAIGTLDMRAAEEFLHRQPIDAGFRRFAETCRRRGVGLTIVSDGLDYYIRTILAHNGIEHVPFYANRLEMSPVESGASRLSITFPHDDAECTRCACCKRNIMLTSSSDEDIIVYVGEGYSDRCPAEYADVVFAKDDLQAFCQRKNISYYLYASFDDVLSRMEELLDGKRLKPRREAAVKRRSAFVCE